MTGIKTSKGEARLPVLLGLGIVQQRGQHHLDGQRAQQLHQRLARRLRRHAHRRHLAAALIYSNAPDAKQTGTIYTLTITSA